MLSLIPDIFFLFGDFRSLFGGIFVRRIWGHFLPVFFEGITHEYLVTLFLVILHPQTSGIALDSKFFGSTRVFVFVALIRDSARLSGFGDLIY